MAELKENQAAAQPQQAQGQAPANPAQAAPNAGGQQQAQPQNNNGTKVDAAQQPQQSAQGQQQVQESMLSKVEEKAFRKYVNAFIEDANKISNPVSRLNECTEILSFFENGACPDLKEKLLEQLTAEKEKLEKLIETSVETEESLGIDVGTLRENALKITEQGHILNEQVSDYKSLCEELQKRNQKLSENNAKLQKQLFISKKLKEKTEVVKNKEIVETASSKEQLEEQVQKLTERNHKLMDRVSELSLSNKELEKKVGTTETKLKEAAILLSESKDLRANSSEEIKKLKEANKDLKVRLQEAEKLYESQEDRMAKLRESYDSLKEEIDRNDPLKHVMPKAEERIGKFLNLREKKGAEVEDYWQDLCERYGEENLKLYESKIRDAKTLREATNAFLKYRTSIDPDFAVAQPTNQYAYRNRAERAKLLEHQGIPVPNSDDWEIDAINADFERRMKAAGLR